MGFMEVALMERVRWRVLLGLAGTLVALAAMPAFAQDWHGGLGAGYAWQNVSGSEASFWTQSYERQGFWLDELTLSYTPGGGAERFRLDGFGFGGAEPDRHARLWWKMGSDWALEVNYDRRAAYFSLSNPDYRAENEDWEISRYKGRVTWDGWSFARLSLDLNYTHRGGWADRQLYGMNQYYGLRSNMDRSLKEGTFRLETKDLPVRMTFEQTYGVYETRDRWAPISPLSSIGTDTLLTTLKTDASDKQTVPTTRFGLTYSTPVVDVAADLLYSHSKLDAGGTSWKIFDLGAGSIGKVSYIDDLAGSARQDTFAGNAMVGVHLSDSWYLRARGDYRDSDMNADILGLDLLRLGRPGTGIVDLGLPVDDRSNFKVRDDGGEVSLEYRHDRLAFWGGFFARERDVRYEISDDENADLRRTSSGFTLGASYRVSGKVRVLAEYEHGDFEKYVFRTDPQTVDRLNFRLQAALGRGWTLDAHARAEKADNPSTESGLFQRNHAFGINMGWTEKQGRAGASFDLDRIKMTTDTGIFLPGGYPDVSKYGMNLYSYGAHGFFKAGFFTFNADFIHLQDRGDTWPFTSWMGYGGATFAGPLGSEFVIFLRTRDYNEDRAKKDDFKVSRYGLIVRWRF